MKIKYFNNKGDQLKWGVVTRSGVTYSDTFLLALRNFLVIGLRLWKVGIKLKFYTRRPDSKSMTIIWRRKRG